jgi:hypothetical protein
MERLSLPKITAGQHCPPHCPNAHHVRLQACLVWWGEVSPFSPYGPTLALLFVLGAAAVKALVADAKRHADDRRTNGRTASVMTCGGAPASPAAPRRCALPCLQRPCAVACSRHAWQHNTVARA